jgi:hypothetical protein
VFVSVARPTRPAAPPPHLAPPTNPKNPFITTNPKNLQTVIEKYTRNARFCLICNYVSKVIPALQSRCTRFRFAPLSPADVTSRLEHVVAQEKCEMGPGGMDALVALGGGDMRRTLNILQSCHMAFPSVDEASVYATAGQPRPQDVADALRWLLNESFGEAMRRLQRLQVEKGVALADIVRELQPLSFFGFFLGGGAQSLRLFFSRSLSLSPVRCRSRRQPLFPTCPPPPPPSAPPKQSTISGGSSASSRSRPPRAST